MVLINPRHQTWLTLSHSWLAALAFSLFLELLLGKRLRQMGRRDAVVRITASSLSFAEQGSEPSDRLSFNKVADAADIAYLHILRLTSDADVSDLVIEMRDGSTVPLGLFGRGRTTQAVASELVAQLGAHRDVPATSARPEHPPAITDSGCGLRISESDLTTRSLLRTDGAIVDLHLAPAVPRVLAMATLVLSVVSVIAVASNWHIVRFVGVTLATGLGVASLLWRPTRSTTVSLWLHTVEVRDRGILFYRRRTWRRGEVEDVQAALLPNPRYATLVWQVGGQTHTGATRRIGDLLRICAYLRAELKLADRLDHSPNR